MRKITPKPSWQERVRLVEEYHQEHLRNNASWRIEDTAESLNRSLGGICEDLLLASWLRTHPKIERFKRIYEALEFIREKKKEMKLGLWNTP